MEQLFKQIRENWVILLFLGTVIMSWTMFTARLASAEEDIKDLQTVVKELNDIKVRLEKIDTKVDFIQQQFK